MKVWITGADAKRTFNNGQLNTVLDLAIERFRIAWDGSKWIHCDWAVEPVGTWICSSHSTSETEQQPMPEYELRRARLARSRPMAGKGWEEIVIHWPVINDFI